MIEVTKNDNFIFSAQLHDGDEGKYVKLELINTSTGSTIGTYTLSHSGGGLYEKKDLQATSLGVYLERYTVYKNAALTNRDRKYNIVINQIKVVEDVIGELTTKIDTVADILNENIDDSDGRVS